MGRFWKIRAMIERVGGGTPMEELYVVAVGDTPEAAMEALRLRKQLDDVPLTVTGEISPATAADFDIRPGNILCVWRIA